MVKVSSYTTQSLPLPVCVPKSIAIVVSVVLGIVYCLKNVKKWFFGSVRLLNWYHHAFATLYTTTRHERVVPHFVL